MKDVRIVVDVMGGDERLCSTASPPRPCRRSHALTVLAAGPQDIVVPFCDSTDRAEALIAPDVITMEDDPIQAVMTKRKSSIVIGCRAVKKGNADVFFSAAVTAAGTAYVTPFRYVTAEGERRPIRPCITSTLPNRSGGLTVFCDMGANPDVDPDDMVRFAQMGAAYASCVLGVKNPRIGLMSNGTEDSKGSHFTKECFPLMRQQVKGFAGNCEGSDMVSGNVDVVVTDGFTGNVALKATEGAAKFIMSELKGALMGSLKGKIAAVLLKDELKAIKAKLSGDAKGGAILLGLRGVVLIGHGATSVEAVKNGTLAAAEAVRADLVQNVADSMEGIL